MGALRVFLDANVLFSAALGGESFALIWDFAAAGRLTLISSPHCVAEARVNLERKRPAGLPAFLGRVATVEPAPDVTPSERALALLPAGDAPVLEAAWRAGADVLVTGDVRDFGALMARNDVGLRVRTPRAFLLDGPDA